jgi:large subunit ribosomal protein L24
MHIRKDDMVVVIRGDDKDPKTPRKVLRVLPEKGKIVVEGVNRVYKHLKAGGRNQQGGRLSKEMPIDVSNVMLYSPQAGRGVRVGFRYTTDGRKERYCKVTGATLGTLGPAKPNHAKLAQRQAAAAGGKKG